MIKRIIFATQNKGKTREIKEILKDLDVEVLSLADAGLNPEIVENGSTFAENAIQKVKSVGPIPETIILADDSGLVVDALGGEPGIYSARYLGENTPHSEKMQDILRRMEGVAEAERSARFVCAMAALCPDGRVYCEEGAFEGQIGYEPRGDHGFGYDPIFFLPEYGMSSAEISPEEKNEISHRYKATKAIEEKLLDLGLVDRA